MKQYGFTLIELLAVIIILVIIALISTPIIIAVIDKTKEASAKSTVSGYISAIENQVMINQLDSSKPEIVDGIYDVPMEQVIVKGKAPTDGWLMINQGQVINYSFMVGEYVVNCGEAPEKDGTLVPKPTDM